MDSPPNHSDNGGASDDETTSVPGVPGSSSPENQKSGSLPSLLTIKLDVPMDVKAQELRLPQALEQALAFKSERAKELGMSAEDPSGAYN